MKNLSISRRQILRAIQAACVALFLTAAGMRPAAADPVFTAPYFTLNGSTVTGSGTSSAAYFNDTGTTGYTVNIQPSANLSDAANSTVEIDHGTVTNKGTLSYTGSDYNLGGVIFNNGGTLTNSGTIDAPGSYSVQAYAGNSKISNTSSGVMSSEYGTYFASPCTFTNAGKITTTDLSFGIPVEFAVPSTVHNTGTMTGSLYGIQMNFTFAAGTSVVTNSGAVSVSQPNATAVVLLGNSQLTETGGSIMSTGSGGIGIEEYGGTARITNGQNGTISGDSLGVYLVGGGTVTNAAAITAANSTSSGVELYGPGEVTNNKGGTISGGYQGVYLLYGGTVTNNTGATISGTAGGIFAYGTTTVKNAGTISVVNNTIESQAIGVNGTGTITNSGSLFLSRHDLVEAILLTNGEVTNSGSIKITDTTTAYGIEFTSYGTATNTLTGKIVTDGTGIYFGGQASVTNDGTIDAGAYGISVLGSDSTVVVNTGMVKGGTDSVLLGGSDSVVTVRGNANMSGTIEGTSVANGNALHFELTGLTSAQTAAFQAYVAQHPNSGSYTIVRNGQNFVYTWADFASVTDNSI